MLAVFIVVFIGKDIALYISIWYPPETQNITGSVLNPEFQNLAVKGYLSGSHLRFEVDGESQIERPLKNVTYIFTVYSAKGKKLGSKAIEGYRYLEKGKTIGYGNYIDGFLIRQADHIVLEVKYEYADIRIKASNIRREESYYYSYWNITADITNLEDKDYGNVLITISCGPEEQKTYDWVHLENFKAGITTTISSYSGAEIGDCVFSARED